jgi:hypothetical protein
MAAAAASAAAAPVAAQTRAMVLFAHGGRVTPLVNLTAIGDDFAPSFAYGGGVAFQMGPGIALRASIVASPTRYRGTTIAPADSGIGRSVWGLDLQVGWPGTSALVPYVYLGAGAAVTSPSDPGASRTTRLAGRAGAGINRVSGIGTVFAELGSLLYRYRGLGFDRYQFDVLVTVGLAVAVPF